MINDASADRRTIVGNYFEDFSLGQHIVHSTPRTVTVGDVSLFTALYGSRFAVQSSDAFAKSIGYPQAPIDDLLTFHMVIGKTVPDISRNAIANLGYAEFRFLKPVYPGDTLYPSLRVAALKAQRTTGVVTIAVTVHNQKNELVLSGEQKYLLKKRIPEAAISPGG